MQGKALLFCLSYRSIIFIFQLKFLQLMCPRVEALDNSLEILQFVSLFTSTKLNQVNFILIRHFEGGPLIKNLQPSCHNIQPTQEFCKLLSYCCFKRKRQDSSQSFSANQQPIFNIRSKIFCWVNRIRDFLCYPCAFITSCCNRYIVSFGSTYNNFLDQSMKPNHLHVGLEWNIQKI